LTFDQSVLTLITFAPLAGALILFLLPREQARLIKGVAIGFSLIPLALSLYLLGAFVAASTTEEAARRFTVSVPWITNFIRVNYTLYVDGLSLALVILTALMTTISLIYSLTIEDRPKEYFALFLLLEVGMLGTFLAIDFFLFYVFWEISLVPMYFVIGMWGGPRREYAAIKFFLYTLVGSVLMLLGMLWLYFHSAPPGQPGTFDFRELRQSETLQAALRDPTYATIAMLVFWGIFLAFAIKVPAWPFHTWLPDAHVEAPTAGSVILAAVLLKMGGYGMLRVLLPIMPAQAFEARYVVIGMAVIGVVYGALVAMAQSDLKKLVAYSSVNHMGYFMMGVGAVCALGPNADPAMQRAAQTAVSGSIFEMFAHGIITGALFLLVGVIYERAHTRDLTEFGGLAAQVPVYSGFFRLMVFASLGLPGLAGFIGEFLAFVGTFPIFPVLTVIAGLGLIISAAFFLWTIQRVLLGPVNPRWSSLRDMDGREWATLAPLAVISVFFGVYPKPFLNSITATVVDLTRRMSGGQ
jgi:NADH-quinone oxidoreductase subunit M